MGPGCGVEELPGLGTGTGFVLQRARWQCEVILSGEQGHPWGRFGEALTVLGDVNGDKLMDVAIGAPGEQENQGAVYLFHGTLGLGISLIHSQVRPCHGFCHYNSSLLFLVFYMAAWKICCYLFYLFCSLLVIS